MFRKFNEINEIRVTEKTVYLLIHQEGPISKSAILNELGGSLTNINRLISKLEDEGLIIGSKGSGRKAGKYIINPNAFYVIGGYINGDVVGMGLCDISGVVHDYEEVLYRDCNTPEKVLDFYGKVYSKLSGRVDRNMLLGTGLGVVGPMDNECKTLLKPEQLQGWFNVPFCQMLEERIDSKVTLDYFAETALMGELFFRKYDLKKDIGLLWLDKGIGSALYNKGKSNLYHRDQSSLMCHQIVNFKGNPCVCGRVGCLTTYGSIHSLLRNLKPFINIDEAALEAYNDMFRKNPWEVSPELESISHAVDQDINNPQINYIFKELEEAYTASLSNFLYLLRPEELILCGRLGYKYQDMFNRILKNKAAYIGYFPEMDTKISWVNLDAEKMIQGGASLVFNKYLNFSVLR